ncbi:hypothetical protein KIN20_001558 [Parelaphostrongylus tenuis]|uniref:Uncharacterized protein n=1 Tax=Parelaphostrongylus tenuis TaxID=148309 RepID=A0AAD5MCQ9_PARTN|nr:hypothetical protein KIN20_001558 [Parelaphostrongylus tenuis]
MGATQHGFPSRHRRHDVTWSSCLGTSVNQLSQAAHDLRFDEVFTSASGNSSGFVLK